MTTRGFFGSSYFASGLFLSDYFRELVVSPVPPTPPRRIFGGLAKEGGAGSFCPKHRKKDERKFIETAVAILEKKVKKTEADLFPVRTKEGVDPKRKREIHALKERLKALQAELLDLKKRLKTQDSLKARIKALEATVARLAKALEKRVETVVHTGITFESIAITRSEKGGTATFSPVDANKLVCMVEEARMVMVEIASGRARPEAILSLAARSPALYSCLDRFLSSLGKGKSAVASGRVLPLTDREMAAVHTFLDAAFESQKPAPAESPSGLEAVVGLGVLVAFGLFVAFASD